MKAKNSKTTKEHIIRLFIISCLFLMQCNRVVENDNLSVLRSTSSGVAIISGQIHNIDAYPMTKDITINVSHVSGKDRVTEIKSAIKEDNTFYFAIDLARPQDVTMEPYLDFLYLVPGDSLHIEFDFKNLSNVRFSGGKSAAINNDFFKYFDATGYRTTGKSYQSVKTDCEINCSWVEIVKRLNNERNNIRKRREKFMINNKAYEEVLFLTEAMIQLDYYRTLVGIILNREHRWNKETMDKEKMMNELNEVVTNYFHSDLYSNSHFKFATSYIMAARLATKPDNKSDFADWVKEVAITDTIRDFMFAVQAANALLQKDLDDFEKYSVHINHEYLLDRLTREYVTVRANLRDFTGNISLENKNFLTEIIAKNDGKVHIIDTYASWCAPCKEVVKQLAALKKEYDGKDVSISFICITPDNETTRDFFSANGFDDSSVYFIVNDEYYKLASIFAPISFPYGILLNREGVIVDHGSHVRPENKLREKIDLLLIQDKLIK